MTTATWTTLRVPHSSHSLYYYAIRGPFLTRRKGPFSTCHYQLFFGMSATTSSLLFILAFLLSY